jgi:hypothetical protein
MTAPPAKLVQSLVVSAQRRELDAIGRQSGTPVLHLKATWADPVLYGGRGARLGGDMDILVRAEAFDSFGSALEARGYRRHCFASSWQDRYFTYKEVTFLSPAGALPVDLHRELTNPFWFDLPAAGCIDRAIWYESVDGPILSLGPEDQVLYAALHYANHVFTLDDRHIEDVARLLAMKEVNWGLLRARSRSAGAQMALGLVLECLHARGANVPSDALRLGGALGVRQRLLRRWVSTGRGLKLLRPRGQRFDYLVLRPLASDRYTALPRLLLRYGPPWLRERLGL